MVSIQPGNRHFSVGPPVPWNLVVLRLPVIKRQTMPGNQPQRHLPRKRTELPEISSSQPRFISLWKVLSQESQKVIGRSYSFIGLLFGPAPTCYSLLLNNINLARKHCLIFVGTGRVCSSSSGKLGFNEK